MTRNKRWGRDDVTQEEAGLSQMAQGLSRLCAYMGPEKAEEAAANISQAMGKTTDEAELYDLAKALSAILIRDRHSQMGARQSGLIGVVGAMTDPGNLFLSARLLESAVEPLPPPLLAQALVDLLKQPFCIGEARRLLLGQLSRHYHRPFAGQWEFVRFAGEQARNLDLLAPPQRPRR
jgi:hypothetical protein